MSFKGHQLYQVTRPPPAETAAAKGSRNPLPRMVMRVKPENRNDKADFNMTVKIHTELPQYVTWIFGRV